MAARVPCAVGVLPGVLQQPTGVEWAVVVDLSGGYKAMIPYVMIMAEGIHSRLLVEQQIRAVAIHDPETGTNPTRKRIVIDIPIRRIKGNLLRAAYKLKEMTLPDTDIVGPDAPIDLSGLFIKEQKSDYKLTDAGLIMVHVL